MHHGSSFKETTRDCLLRFATLTKSTERQDGAHHGRRTFCSPFRQATGDVIGFSIYSQVSSPEVNSKYLPKTYRLYVENHASVSLFKREYCIHTQTKDEGGTHFIIQKNKKDTTHQFLN